jgi:hypothetical protein
VPHLSDLTWSAARRAELAEAEELVLVIARADRSPLRVPVWPVLVDGELYVRSYKGVTSGWYRGVVADPSQSIELAGGDTRVVFETVDRTDAVNADIDSAYLTKYARFDYRDAMVEPAAVDATLRIVPQP